MASNNSMLSSGLVKCKTNLAFNTVTALVHLYQL